MTIEQLISELHGQTGESNHKVVLVGPDGETPLEILKVEYLPDGETLGIFAEMPDLTEGDDA